MLVADWQGPPIEWQLSWEWAFALHFILGYSFDEAITYVKYMSRRGTAPYGRA